MFRQYVLLRMYYLIDTKLRLYLNHMTIYATYSLLRGLGAGGSPAVGAQAATESRDEITEMVKDAPS